MAKRAADEGAVEMRFQCLRFICAALSLVVGTVAGAERPGITSRPVEFRGDSELVLLPLVVKDRAGSTVLGLGAGDFVVAEDGVPQDVLSLSRWDGPASIGIVFDASGSMKASIRTAVSAVRTLLQENRDRDEAFLITFADSPRLETDFTNNSDEIPNRLLWTRPRGATALFDAVCTGLGQLKRATNPRRVLVIITDGGDNHSRHSFKELLSEARESDAQVFAVAIRRNVHDSDEQRGRIQLDQLANETGGHLVIVNSDADVFHAIAELNDLIRNEYLLSYRPAKGPRDGKWHRVRVQLRPTSKDLHYRIYSKNGYYAPVQ